MYTVPSIAACTISPSTHSKPERPGLLPLLLLSPFSPFSPLLPTPIQFDIPAKIADASDSRLSVCFLASLDRRGYEGVGEDGEDVVVVVVVVVVVWCRCVGSVEVVVVERAEHASV